MTFHKDIYFGDLAAGFRHTIIKKIKNGRPQFGVYVISPSSSDGGILDIIPANMLNRPEYSDITIIGIAMSVQESYEVCKKIITDVYEKTSGYDVRTIL